MKSILLSIFFIIFCSLSASAGKIEKGFGALEIYNYFEAKQIFEKSIKKMPVPAAYGLSIIYYRQDNPFHNLDSAFRYIVISANGYSSLTAKEKERFNLLGADSLSVLHQRDLVSTALYRIACKIRTADAMDNFIANNYWSEHVDSAVYLRDSIRFSQACKFNTSEQYQEFATSYPTSVFTESALARYEQQLYLENTASNTLISYIDFVRRFPNSPYRTDAEDKIFELYTGTGSVQAYEKFIEDNPDNHNVASAWRKMYNSHVQQNSYSTTSIESFATNFPEFPYMEEIEREILLSNTTYFPFKTTDGWGYVSEDGQHFIDPKFEDADEFSEGLAVVKINGQYGYINKTGQIFIQPIFDDALPFHEGHAIVEFNGKLGMINRNGEFIIAAQYDDLGNLNNGLTYFLKDSLYGYFDNKGVVRIQPRFSDANDFINGKAIVAQNENYGLIDPFGTTFIPMKYQELRQYEHDWYLAMFDDYYGIISIQGDTLLNFSYDYVGPFSNNRAIVEKDGMYNYINRDGNILLQVWLNPFSEYRQLAMFTNNYALIQQDGKYNLIDTTGKKLFAQPKEKLGDYAAVMAVEKSGKWGYVYPTGAQAIPFTFTHAFSFNGNYAIAGSEPFSGIINKAGVYVINPVYEEITFLNDTLIIAKSLGNFGLMTLQGDTLLNFVYIKIEPISASVVKLERGSDLFYYNLSTNQFLKKEDE
ncbi:MAG: WG repeat-containing protein [Crocinitomicaceae bacterium]|nr:WG repeat-containing protein [Crocinitomicaceae bacterium]MBK8925620.1 WG repeat-containing protein [Crocinitomicaceae bacterium]